MSKEDRTKYTGKYFRDIYEVFHDSLFNLEYVRLGTQGLKIIADNYNKDERYLAHNINIFVEDYPYSKLDETYLKLNRHIREMTALPHDEVRGILLVRNASIDDSAMDDPARYAIYHVTPYMIAKFKDQITVVDFEHLLDEKRFVCRAITKKVPNYNYLQADYNSCSALAIDILKNVFLDDAFLAQLKNPQEELKSVKEAMGQRLASALNLSEAKKEKYLRKFRGLDANMKAFYKGHFYALQMNPQHLEMLDKNSRDLFLEIDAIRKEKRAQKGATSDDLDATLPPDASVKTLDATKFREITKELS